MGMHACPFIRWPPRDSSWYCFKLKQVFSFYLFTTELLTSPCKNTKSESFGPSIIFCIISRCLSWISIKIGPFSFSQHHLTTIKVGPLSDSVATVVLWFLFFLMHRFSDLTDKSFLESGNPGLYEGGSFCSRRQERWAATKTSAAKTAAAPKTSSCTLLFCKTSSHFQNAGTPPEEEKLSFVNRRAIDVTF